MGSCTLECPTLTPVGPRAYRGGLGVQTKTASGWKLLVYGYEKTASAAALLVGAFLVLWNEIKLLLITKTFIELRFVLQLRCR